MSNAMITREQLDDFTLAYVEAALCQTECLPKGTRDTTLCLQRYTWA